MQEKYIEGYGKRYKINQDGKVISCCRKMFNGKVFWKSKERILKQSIAKVGYKVVVLSEKTKKMVYVHRLLAIAFIPNLLKKPQVNHKDANKLNNDLSNLEWVTQKENNNHARRLGIYSISSLKGEKNGNSIFKDSEVLKIRNLKGKESLKKTAKRFNTKISTVWNIQNYKTWKHLT